MPVNREQCVSAALPGILDPSRQSHSSTHRLFSTDEEYINLTWKLSYSGGSPRAIMLSKAFGLSREYNMTDTEYNKAMAHRTAQSMREHCFPASLLCLTCVYIPEGLHGHQFEENIHSRRVFFLETVRSVPPLFCFPWLTQFPSIILRILVTLLQIHYWYTRISTIGISIPATLLFASAASLNYVMLVLSNGHGKNWSVLRWCWRFVIALPIDMALPLVMVKAVTRAEVRWRGYIPVVWFAPATHRERASVRLDAQVGWRSKVLVGFLPF